MFALDNVVHVQDVFPLLKLAHVIKLDMTKINRDNLHIIVKFLRQYELKILAERVETQEEFELTRELGFDYFQGYFLCKPKVVQRRQMPPHRLVIMHLLSELQDEDIDFQKLEAIVAKDAVLGYKLLKIGQLELLRAFIKDHIDSPGNDLGRAPTATAVDDVNPFLRSQ